MGLFNTQPLKQPIKTESKEITLFNLIKVYIYD